MLFYYGMRPTFSDVVSGYATFVLWSMLPSFMYLIGVFFATIAMVLFDTFDVPQIFYIISFFVGGVEVFLLILLGILSGIETIVG